MAILTFSDITSEPVRSKVMEQDIDETTNLYLKRGQDYYESHILRKFGLTPAEAKDPASQTTKNVVMLRVCVAVATDNVGKELTAITDSTFADAWKARLKSFQEAWQMAEDNLLKSDVALEEPEDNDTYTTTAGIKAINRYG